MQSSNPTVGVVVLNHNGKALTEVCLRSLLASPYPQKNIFVVDNASTDGSVDYLRSQFSEVTIIENKENLGVTGGRNSGFRVACQQKVDYVLSLDNDARIEPQAIGELIRVATSDPQIGILGPKTYHDDGSGLLQCVGGRITYTENVTVERGTNEPDRGQYDQIEEVDYFPGCALMARREVFEQLDFLDESFYGYGHEDTDFCTRAAQMGYRIVYVPQAVVWHGGSSTIGSYSPRKKYLEAVNSMYYVRKYSSASQRWKYFLYGIVGLIPAFLLQACYGNQKAVLAKARGLWDGFKKPLN
ncbi:MAG: glycosyltransferase family 2 protein [Waterburya sp.]